MTRDPRGDEGCQGCQGCRGVPGVPGMPRVDEGSQGCQGSQGVTRGPRVAEGCEGCEGSQGVTRGAKDDEDPRGVDGWRDPRGVEGAEGWRVEGVLGVAGEGWRGPGRHPSIRDVSLGLALARRLCRSRPRRTTNTFEAPHISFLSSSRYVLALPCASTLRAFSRCRSCSTHCAS